MDIAKVAGGFADVARRYCAWAEAAPGDPPAELRQARQLLTELYLAAICLPEVEQLEDVDVQGRTYEQYKEMCQRFAGLPIAGYWEVQSPLKIEGDAPAYQILPDDLADIYGDLKRGLNFYEAGHINNAVFEWRLLFNVHWGQHLLGALRAIHEYYADADL